MSRDRKVTPDTRMPCPPSSIGCTAAVFKASGQMQWPFLAVPTLNPQTILDVALSGIPTAPAVASIWPALWACTPFVSRAPMDKLHPTRIA